MSPIVSIRKSPYPKNIYKMLQDLPNQGFRLLKVTSVTKISIPSAEVYYYCAWYTYFRNRRYKLRISSDLRYFKFLFILGSNESPANLEN